MNDLYSSGQYLDNNPTWHAEDSEWKSNLIIYLIQKNKIIPSSIAEVGCGGGLIISLVAEHFSESGVAHGYDISPQAISICEKIHQSRVQYFLEDFSSSEAVKTYGVVLVIDILEHIENYWEFLRSIRAKSRNFVFHIPLDMSVRNLLRGSKLLGFKKQVGHIHYFTRELAISSLEDCGFKVLDVQYTCKLLDRPENYKQWIGWLPRKLLQVLSPNLAARLLGGYSILVLAAGAGDDSPMPRIESAK